MLSFPFCVRLICGSATGLSWVRKAAAIRMASGLAGLSKAILQASKPEGPVGSMHIQVSIWPWLKVGASDVGYIIHKLGYVHNRAGIAALFAALSNKECSISLSPQQIFSLASIDIPHIPCSLIMMGQVLIIFYHRVLAVEIGQNVFVKLIAKQNPQIK